jgi:protein O-GlcNAc transferase
MATVTLRPPEALRQAITAHSAGKLSEAERLCQALLSAEPDFFDGLQLLAHIQTRLGRANKALATYNRALAVRPDAVLFNNRGAILQGLKRFDEALASCEQAIALKPDYADALYNRGVLLQELQRFEDALASYEKALAAQPSHAAALNNRGAVLRELKRFEEALASYERLLAVRANDVETLNNRGVVLQELKRFEDALASYDQALAVKPNDAVTHQNRGAVLQKLKRLDEALASFQQALSLQPDDLVAFKGWGNTLRELNRLEDALASYEQVLALRPADCEALNNRGVTLHALKRFEEALVSYDKVLAASVGDVKALNNRGLALHELRRFDEALASYEEALTVEPTHVAALNNRGITLQALNRCEDAFASYDAAVTVRPDYADAWCNRGNALRSLNHFEQAIASYERAMTVNPDHKQALNGLAGSALKICDWRRQDMIRDHVCRPCGESALVISSLFALSYSEDQSFHFLCAQNDIRERIPTAALPLWRGAIWRNDRIKVAYIRGLPMAYLMAELFELHDRSKFEVIGVSFGPDDHSAMRSRLTKAFDQFFDMTELADQEVAKVLSDLRVDIAVDLQGHQQGARPGIFALRPAPIQVNYLGYPGTTGARFMDYIIADKIVLPFNRQSYYAESIVHLPNCYQVNDRKLTIAARTPTRKELRLPDTGFVFCSFNNSWKITSAVFDVWMRLLHAIEGSVLWVLSDNKDTENNLRIEAINRGVASFRLVFAARTSTEDHLARLRVADLFLDTLPYNAHATASHALWAGLPVLTCQGEAFAGRVGASLLSAIGLRELVTHSLAEYEAVALRLAQEPQLLASYRARLAENRLTHPLFDTDRFRQNLEAAFSRMWERWQNGENPMSFEVRDERVPANCKGTSPSGNDAAVAH